MTDYTPETLRALAEDDTVPGGHLYYTILANADAWQDDLDGLGATIADLERRIEGLEAKMVLMTAERDAAWSEIRELVQQIHGDIRPDDGDAAQEDCNG